jgi:hypothetical protein
MMNVGLIDVDSHNFPNLALMKISAYHKKKGHSVEMVNLFYSYDLVYQSKIFDFTDDYDYIPNAKKIIKGGTGYDLSNKLDAEIENIYPDYSIYPDYKQAYGFLTRGCPRKCSFCIVSKKEGCKSYKVANLNEFWKGQKEIKLLDPNLLASKNSSELLQQLINSKSYVDFTQGVDARLLNDENIDLLKRVKTKVIHFAWDDVKEKESKIILSNLKLFKEKTEMGYRKLKVYVLTNYGTTHEEDLYRVYKLKEMGYDPYIMIFDKKNAPKQTKHLQRWVNNKIIFRTVEKFEDYNK